MKCSKCGTENKNNGKFCGHCGNPIYRKPQGFERKSHVRYFFQKKWLKIVVIFLVTLLFILGTVWLLTTIREVPFHETITGKLEFKDFTEDDVVFQSNELFVKNQLLITTDKKYSYNDVKRIVSKHNGRIVGCIEYTNDYQVEFNNKDYNNLLAIEHDLESELENSVVSLHKAYHINCNESNTNTLLKNGKWWREAVEIDELDKANYSYNTVRVGVFDNAFDTDNDAIKEKIKKVYTNDYDVKKSSYHGTSVCSFICSSEKNYYHLEGASNNAELFVFSMHYSGFVSSNYIYKYAIALMLLDDCKVLNFSNGFDEMIVAASIGDRDALDDLETFKNDLTTYLNKFIENGYEFIIVKAAGNLNDKTWIKCVNDKSCPYGIKKLEEEDDKIQYEVLPEIVYDTKYDIFGAIDDSKARQRIIMVGASTKNNQSANFSVRGKGVDIYAPGVDLVALGAENGEISLYSGVGGTSYSAPIVSGVVARMFGVNSQINANDIKYIITATATQTIDGEKYDYSSASGDIISMYKYLINAKNAVEYAKNWKTSVTVSSKNNTGFVFGIVKRKNNDNSISLLQKNCECEIILYKGNKMDAYSLLTDSNYQEAVPYATFKTNIFGEFDYELPAGDYYLKVNYNDANYASAIRSFSIIKGEVCYLDDIILENIRDLHSDNTNSLQDQVNESATNVTDNNTAEDKNQHNDDNASDKTGIEDYSQIPADTDDLEFLYTSDEVDLGSSIYIRCKQSIDFSSTTIQNDGDRCFKVYVFKDYLHLIAGDLEGKANYTITTSDGRKGSFTLYSVLKYEAYENMQRYVNTIVPFHSTETKNELTIEKIDNGHVVFRIQQGGKNRPYIPHAEGEIYDNNKMNFDTVDSLGNKYTGYMEFNMNTIYLRLEVYEKSKFSDINMACECRLLDVS